MTEQNKAEGEPAITGTDNEGRLARGIAIVGGVLAIIGSLYTFWNWLKDNFWWLLAHWWVAALAALVIVICYSLVKRTTRGCNLWQWIARTFRSVASLKTLVLILVALNAFYGGMCTANYSRRSKSKTITGTIYYLPCSDNSGLDPVADVKVVLPQQNRESTPTKSDGKFSISGVPSDSHIYELTAELGGLYYPIKYNEGQANYAVIPRPCGPPPRWEVHDPWKIASADECVSDTEETSKIKRRYLLRTLIPAEGRREAILTLELQDTVDVTMLSAFVLSPSHQTGGYREAMEGLNEETARRWVFDLPVNGLTVLLEVCLGSKDSSASLSERHLRTSYELR
jgi:uncharacterized membrane protein